MTELTMPKLSDSMEQGTILTWLKTDGEQVHAGEDLLEIETDKATVTHQADADGILEIIAAEGTTLPVGAPLARVGAGAARAEAVVAEVASRTEAPVAPARSETNGAASEPYRARRPTPLARRAALAPGVSL